MLIVTVSVGDLSPQGTVDDVYQSSFTTERANLKSARAHKMLTRFIHESLGGMFHEKHTGALRQLFTESNSSSSGDAPSAAQPEAPANAPTPAPNGGGDSAIPQAFKDQVESLAQKTSMGASLEYEDNLDDEEGDNGDAQEDNS